MKRLFFATTLLLLAGSATVQGQKHNLDIVAGGGLQTASLTLDEGDNKPRFGWNVGANYRCMFTQNWGFGIGLGMGYYKAKYDFGGVHVEQTYTDTDNLDNEPREFIRKLDFDGFVESQRILALEIPVAAYFMKPFNEKVSLKTDVGVKLMLPVWNSYHVSEGDVNVSAYSPLTGVDYTDLPQHNLTSYDLFYGNAELRSVSAAAFVDAGVQIGQLYLGGYFSYAFVPFAKDSDRPVFDGTEYIGIASSNLADDARLISAGIKVGWTIEKKE